MKEVQDRYGRTLLNRFDRFVDSAREASSRGAAFLYAVIGVVAQVAHNSLLAYEVSMFENPYLKISQAIVVAMAISFALIYFVLTADGKDYSKTGKVVTTFYSLEVFLNLIYYFKKIVFDNLYSQVSVSGSWSDIRWSEPNWFLLLIGIPFAVFIPYIIKSYAGSIQAYKPALALDDEDFVKSTELSKLIDERVDLAFKNAETSLPEKLSELISQSSVDDTKLADITTQYSETLAAMQQLADEVKHIKNKCEDYDIASLVKHIDAISENVALHESRVTELSKSVDKSIDDLRSNVKKYVTNELETMQLTPQSNVMETITEDMQSIKDKLLKQSESLSEIKTELKSTIKSGTSIKLKSGEKQSEFMVL